MSLRTILPASAHGIRPDKPVQELAMTEACYLENFIPNGTSLSVRPGYVEYSTGLPSAGNQLFLYSSADGLQKIFARAGTEVLDVTSPGAAIFATNCGGLALWSSQINVAGTSYLYLQDGVNDPILYNGSTWMTVTDLSTPAITGVSPSTLFCGVLFKNRLFFLQQNSTKVWYLPLSSVGGAASSLDLGAYMRKGGAVYSMASLTLDSGTGIDDRLIIVTTEGEVLAFAGTNPADATAWSLQGVFEVAPPLGGVRNMTKAGGDLLLLTISGIESIIEVLAGKSLRSKHPIYRIASEVRSAVNQLGTSSNQWGLFFAPALGGVLLNLPPSNANSQYFMSYTSEGSPWTKFTKLYGAEFLNIAEAVYFISGFSVYKMSALLGTDNGAPIQAFCLTSFQYLKTPAPKLCSAISPFVMATGGQVSYGATCNVNWDLTRDPSLNTTVLEASSGGIILGTFVFEAEGAATFFFGGDRKINDKFLIISKLGMVLAPFVTVVSSAAQTEYRGCEILYRHTRSLR